MAHSVALVLADLSAGGAQRVASSLANQWAERGRPTTVITLADTQSDYFRLNANVRRVALGLVADTHSPFQAIGANLRRVWALRRALAASGAHVTVSFVGVTNILTVLATRGLGLPTVISERNDPVRQRLGGPWGALRRALYRHADVVTANSHAALSALAAYVPKNKLQYVPNPLATATGHVTRLPTPLILHVGRLAPQKAQGTLLAAFARLPAQIRGNWRLALAGEGPDLESLQRLCDTLGIADRVDFLGRCDVWPQYARAAILALPSRFEGTPNVVLEAMSMGLPVIVSDRSAGALDYVVHDKTGLVVRTDDPADLSAALERLIGDPRLREHLGANAVRAVAQCAPEHAFAAWDRVLDLAVPA